MTCPALTIYPNNFTKARQKRQGNTDLFDYHQDLNDCFGVSTNVGFQERHHAALSDVMDSLKALDVSLPQVARQKWMILNWQTFSGASWEQTPNKHIQSIHHAILNATRNQRDRKASQNTPCRIPPIQNRMYALEHSHFRPSGAYVPMRLVRC